MHHYYALPSNTFCNGLFETRVKVTVLKNNPKMSHQNILKFEKRPSFGCFAMLTFLAVFPTVMMTVC